MPRTDAEFDRAVAEATEIFWRKGFGDASIEDVVQATGFNRYAIYTAFGDKRGLFLAVLDAYQARGRSIFLSALETPNAPPFKAVARVFAWAIDQMAKRRTGCLLCNVAVDAGRNDAEVGARIDAYLAEIETAYLHAMTLAAARGELNPALSPAEAARLLMTLKLGVGARAQAGAAPEDLRAVIATGLAALGASAAEIAPALQSSYEPLIESQQSGRHLAPSEGSL